MMEQRTPKQSTRGWEQKKKGKTIVNQNYKTKGLK